VRVEPFTVVMFHIKVFWVVLWCHNSENLNLISSFVCQCIFFLLVCSVTSVSAIFFVPSYLNVVFSLVCIFFLYWV
jgi:hypothetical protein